MSACVCAEQTFDDVAQKLDRHTLLLIVSSPNLPPSFEGNPELESAYCLYWQEQIDKLEPHSYHVDPVQKSANPVRYL